MASIKFIKGIGDEELVRLVWEFVKCDGDELIEGTVIRPAGDRESGNPYDVSLSYKTRLDGEDEDSFLTDTYEVDDYDIAPFDWGGGDAVARIKVAWRKAMFARYGAEYAEWHLFGALEASLDNSGWLLD